MTFNLPRSERSNGAIPVNVQKFEQIDETTARVLVSYVGERTERALSMAVASTWVDSDGASAVRVAPGSAHVFERQNNGATLVDVVLKRNQITKPYTEEASAGMKAVAANVFADEDDMIWSVVGEGETRMLVQAGSENMADILGSRRTLSIATASLGSTLGENFKAGDVVMCYDAAEERQFIALAVAEGHVYDPEQETIVEVSASEVVIVDDGAIFGADATFAAADIVKLDAENVADEYLKYIQKLYKNHPAYFQRVKEVVKAAFARLSFAA